MKQMIHLGSLVLMTAFLTGCQASREAERIEPPPGAEPQTGEGFVPEEKEAQVYKAPEPDSSPKAGELPAMEAPQERKTIEEQEASAEPKPESPSDPEPNEESTYTIQKGDTLWSIAESHYGDGSRWKDILEANPEIEDPKNLREGQEIVLPDL